MEEVIAHIVQPISWVDVAISVCSLVISAAAVVISLTTYWSQKEHNKNSVRPILNITFGDYENDLYIRVDNNGVGPAIVAGVTCTCCHFSEPKSADSLIGLMPYPGRDAGNSRRYQRGHDFFHRFCGEYCGQDHCARGRDNPFAHQGAHKIAIVGLSQFPEGLLRRGPIYGHLRQ